MDPRTREEETLVQSIADTEWRLLRIPTLEAGIYALGRLEFAELVPEQEDPKVNAALIDAKIFLVYQKQLNNLSIQEGRLRRQREKDRAELMQLKTLRQTEIGHAATFLNHARKHNEPFDISEFGFEITMSEIELKAAEYEARRAHREAEFRNLGPWSAKGPSSAKGADARHQTANPLASPSGGALDTATVLRGWGFGVGLVRSRGIRLLDERGGPHIRRP